MKHMEQCLEAPSRSNVTIGKTLTFLALTDHFVFNYMLPETARRSRDRRRFRARTIGNRRIPRTFESFWLGTGVRCERPF
jgi:hypothetical protein